MTQFPNQGGYNSPLDYQTSSMNVPVAQATPEVRSAFIRRTYVHLGGAILAFVAACAAVQVLVPDTVLVGALQLVGGWGWLLVLGAAMAMNFAAHKMADNASSLGTQYAGLGLGILAQVLIFTPLLTILTQFFPPEETTRILMSAGVITLIIFAALTAFVFLTGYDFSFIGGALFVVGLGAMAAIALSIFLGFSLGIWFTAAMIAFAAGYILYDTSNVQRNYFANQHVAASLALFGSVTLLLYYVIRLVMQFAGDE